jgi:hypothetical protein
MAVWGSLLVLVNFVKRLKVKIGCLSLQGYIHIWYELNNDKYVTLARSQQYMHSSVFVPTLQTYFMTTAS